MENHKKDEGGKDRARTSGFEGEGEGVCAANKLYAALLNTPEAQVLGKQLLRLEASVGVHSSFILYLRGEV